MDFVLTAYQHAELLRLLMEILVYFAFEFQWLSDFECERFCPFSPLSMYSPPSPRRFLLPFLNESHSAFHPSSPSRSLIFDLRKDYSECSAWDRTPEQGVWLPWKRMLILIENRSFPYSERKDTPGKISCWKIVVTTWLLRPASQGKTKRRGTKFR